MGAGKKEVLPVIPWYWRDWRASTARAVMSELARGLYRELLDAHYGDEACTLPNDDRQLAALAGTNLKTWLKVKEEVLPWLPVTEGGRRQNPRAVQEWEKGLRYRETRRENGSKGGNKRWHGDGGAIPELSPSDGTATDSPMAPDSYPPPQPPPQPFLDPHHHPQTPAEPEAPDGAGGGGVAQSASEPKSEPLPELLAAWNRERGKRSLPPDELTQHHRGKFAALLTATRGDLELALGAIEAYVAMDDKFVRDAAWRIRLFPHRMEAAIAAAAKKRPRRAPDPVPAEPEESDDPQRSAEIRANIRSLVGKRPRHAKDQPLDAQAFDVEKKRQKEALAAHEREKGGAA